MRALLSSSLAFIFFSLNLQASDVCREKIQYGSCDYYLCEEEQHKLGDRGYFLAFGHKYCSLFMGQVFTQLSPPGQHWLAEVSHCLQRDLLESHNEKMTAHKIKQVAIRQHSKCYIETRACQLSRQDRKIILKNLRSEWNRPSILREALQILLFCPRHN